MNIKYGQESFIVNKNDVEPFHDCKLERPINVIERPKNVLERPKKQSRTP